MATYNAKDIKTLDRITQVRKRIGMWLGSNTGEGATVGLRELFDNSIDEALSGHGDTVIVRLFEDNSAEVQDFGRGLPVDNNAEGVNGIILTIGTIGSGGKFSGETISGGLNGVGASAINAASARFDVTVYRDNKMHQLSFKEGRPGFFAKENDPASKFTANSEIKVSKDPRSAAERKKNPTGTVIRFWLDYTVFMPDSRFNVEDVKARLKASCFLLPTLTAIVEDLRDSKAPVIDTYHFSAGIVDMVPTLTSQDFIVKPISIQAESSFDEMTNVLQEDNTLKQQEVKRPVNIDAAFGYTGAEDTTFRSFVNLIQTKQGGTHESGLWRALSRVLVNQIKNTRGLLKAKEEAPTLEDVKDGFVGVISIKFPEPTFSGQAKEELKTQQIISVVSQTVGNELKAWLDNKKNAAQAKALLQRIVEASRIRLAAKAQKETARKKTALETATSMPSKLVECAEPGVNSELHICEGDSALGTMKLARDATKQALFPIRGKILNVHKASVKDMLDNAECAAIIQVLGAGMGKSFDLSQARYERVCLEVDADTDGAHIRTLLITFFYRYMRPLVEAGNLYATQPPLYVLKTKGKNAEIHYLSSDAERDRLIARLNKAGVKFEPLQRLKGLGEMDADEFWDTTMNPETRTLRRVTIEEAEAADAMLELAMGNKVEPRRDWIMSSRAKISDDDLDV